MIFSLPLLRKRLQASLYESRFLNGSLTCLRLCVANKGLNFKGCFFVCVCIWEGRSFKR